MSRGDGAEVRVERAQRAVQLALGPAGPTPGRLRRVGTSVLIDLPALGVLARVDDRVPAERAVRQVAVARALAEAEVPAVREAVLDEQPVRVDVDGRSMAVTCWRLEQVLDEPIAPSALGRLARRLHDATRPPSSAWPRLDPFGAIAEQLDAARAGTTAAEDLDRLEWHRRVLADEWADTVWSDPPALVHGDLHPGNVLVTPSGPRLADLELAGVGPTAYDLAPAVVAVRRYGQPAASLDELLVAYGGEDGPVPLPPEVAVSTYELWVTAWALANRAVDAAHEHEAEVRLARWRPGFDPSRAATWTLR